MNCGIQNDEDNIQINSGGGLEVQVRIEVFHTELILLKATQFIEFRWC
jgi:hypothetical protein